MRSVPTLALAALLAACESGVPVLPLTVRTSFSLPPDGTTAPAPRSLAITPDGNLVCLDTAGRVLVLSPTGALIRGWRMPDSAVGKPEGVRWLADGRLAVCDTHYHQVVVFDGATGAVVLTFGREGRGPGEFGFPVAIDTDPEGRLYVCEYGGNDRIQVFDRAGKYLREFASFGTGPGQLQRPGGIAWHDHRVYVADATNHRIHVFAESGEYQGMLGAGEGVGWDFPYDLEVGPEGDVWTVEYGAGRVRRLARTGEVLGELGRTGTGDFDLRTPWALAVDATTVYVADTGNRRVVAYARR